MSFKCEKCEEDNAVPADGIDGYGYLCRACLRDYGEEVEIMDIIRAKQEEELSEEE